MKHVLLLNILLACGAAALAQTRQGVVIFERKMDVYRHLQNDQMRAMVPQFQTARYELDFRDSVSAYKAVPKDEAPDPFDGGGGHGVVIRFNGPGDGGVLFHNFGNNSLLEETLLDEKSYVIADTIHSYVWKLTDDTKTILGHPCKKATATGKRGVVVEAWYAVDMPVPAGPDHFCDLPGLILMIDQDNGAVVYTAVEWRPAPSAKDLAPPTGSKRITRADYDKKLDEVYGPADSLGRRTITRTM